MLNIKSKRLALGWTQTELAEKMGVIQNTVWSWEAGVKMPTADKLPRLASLLGCTIDDLYDAAAYGEEINAVADRPAS